MGHRDSEYVLLKSRKAKKTKQHYHKNEDYDDDDDDEPELYRRLPRRKQRVRYASDDENDSDHRPALSDNRIKVRKTVDGDQVILDEDNNVLKVIRDNRSPSFSPHERRRPRRRPREAQTYFYEKPNGRGHIVSRPSRKTSVYAKKTQVMYADDEPIKVMKRVIIDPRTGDRETTYERDKPRKQQKYYSKQRPPHVLYDSDEYDDQEPMQYVRIAKHRTVPTEVPQRHEPTSRYVVIKQRTNSDSLYANTTRMPALRNPRRMVYEVPTKQPLTTYIYPHGKYYSEY